MAGAADAGPSIRFLATAELSSAASTAPPRDATDWRPVRLPTAVVSAAAPNSHVWYRLAFDLPDAPRGTWAICVRRAEERVAFFLDGDTRAISEHAAGPEDTGWNFPYYVEVPGERLHAGQNVIYARLDASSVGEHQLAPVMVGPASELLGRFRRQLVLQVIGPAATAAVTAVVGLFMTVLWLQRRADTALGWLGFACLCMILHFARFFLPGLNGPAATLLRAVGDASFGWIVLTLILFVFRMAGRRHRYIEAFVAAYALAGTAFLFATMRDPSFVLVRDLYTLGLFPVELAVVAYQCLIAWRTRTPMMIALALAATVTVGLGLHDLYLRNIATLTDAAVYLMPYSPLLLTLAAGGAVIERMVRSHRTVDALNLELEGRIAAREAELARSYARTGELERHAAVAQERRRIMRDMHDGLGSALISSISLAERGALPPREMADILRRCVDELRLAIDSLKPLGADLNAVLANFRHRFTNRLATVDLHVEWLVEDLPHHPGLTPDAILQVMRIVQEALTNVIKHAQATRACVAARHDASAGAIRLAIADDGRGFDRTAPSGEGLASMRARAARLGAQLEIISSPGAGTEIRLFLPLSQQAPQHPQAG
jgi:signal transduction histidine kinase